MCLFAFLPLEQLSSLRLSSRSARPGLGQAPTGVRQQLRQRLGLADDRQEVGVAAPPRHDVLVQVGGDAGAGDRALVQPDVEAVRRRRPRAAPASPAGSARRPRPSRPRSSA